jgi:hypothetical protein
MKKGGIGLSSARIVSVRCCDFISGNGKSGFGIGCRSGIRSKQMTDSEKKLLIALIQMVKQYLEERGGEVSNDCMSAGEHAFEVLAAFGLMKLTGPGTGRWTEAGNEFIDEWVYPPLQIHRPNQTRN